MFCIKIVKILEIWIDFLCALLPTVVGLLCIELLPHVYFCYLMCIVLLCVLLCYIL
jgi:hypothetical protein